MTNYIVLAVIIVGVIVFVAAGFRSVRPGFAAAVISKNVPVREVGSGYHWATPFLETVRQIPTYKFTIRRTFDVSDNQGGWWRVKLAVTLRVSDPTEALYASEDPIEQFTDRLEGPMKKVSGYSTEQIRQLPNQQVLEGYILCDVTAIAAQHGLEVIGCQLGVFHPLGDTKNFLDTVYEAIQKARASIIAAKADARVTKIEREAYGEDWLQMNAWQALERTASNSGKGTVVVTGGLPTGDVNTAFLARIAAKQSNPQLTDKGDSV